MTHLVGQKQNLFPNIQQPAIPSSLGGKEADNALFEQMLQLVFQMGVDSGSSNATTRLLTFENRELRQQLIQRAEALEIEWLGKAEYFSAKVDTIYFKFKQLHQNLATENLEALRISKLEMTCVTANGKEFDIRALGRACGENFSIYGTASETIRAFETYSSLMQKHMDAWEELHLKCTDQLKAAVKAEVQKIQSELLLEKPIPEPTKMQVAVLNAHSTMTIDARAIFQSFTHRHQLETQTLDERNDALRDKNESLRAKKIELGNKNEQLLGVLHQQLQDKLNGLDKSIGLTNKQLAHQVREYPQLLEELGHQPNSRRSGHYKKGIELEKKISSALNAIAILGNTLQKEMTP